MSKADWLQVIEDAGDELDHNDYVLLPRTARLMLAQMVSDEAFLFPGLENVYQGYQAQVDLYHEAIAAYNNLMNPIDLETISQSELAFLTVDNLIMNLPGLTAFWPCSSFYLDASDANADPEIFDVSGNGNHLTGKQWPMVGIDDSTPYPVSFVRFDAGDNQYAKRDVSPNMSIKGYELTSLTKGLTICGVFRADSISDYRYIIDRWGGSSTYRSWILWRNDNNRVMFNVCDGTSVDSIGLPGKPAGEWVVMSGRYKYGEFIDIGLNLTRQSNDSLSVYNINGVSSQQVRMCTPNAGSVCDMSRWFVVQQFIEDETLNYIITKLMYLYGIEF